MANLRGLSVKAIAGGLAVLAAGGGAYYYYVYLPQTENASAVAARQAVKSPAGAKPAKPPAARPPAASAVPAVPTLSAPVIAAPAQPAIAASSNIAATASVQQLKPVLESTSEPVQPKPAVKKSAPKKPRAKRPSVQPTRMGSGPDVTAMSQQLTSPLPAVLPESGVATEPAAVTRIGTPKYNDILTAVLRSDKDAVRHLLDMGRWVDKPGSSGTTPLMAAVMNRDAQMVQLLLEHGAEPSAQALKLARKNKDDATVLLLEQRGAH